MEGAPSAQPQPESEEDLSVISERDEAGPPSTPPASPARPADPTPPPPPPRRSMARGGNTGMVHRLPVAGNKRRGRSKLAPGERQPRKSPMNVDVHVKKRRRGQNRPSCERDQVQYAIPFTATPPADPLFLCEYENSNAAGKGAVRYVYTLTPTQMQAFETNRGIFEILEPHEDQCMTRDENGAPIGMIRGARTTRAVQVNEFLGFYPDTDVFPDMAAFDAAIALDPRRSGNYAMQLSDGRVLDASLNARGVALCNDATIEDTRFEGRLPCATFVEVSSPDGRIVGVAAVSLMPLEAGQPVYIPYGDLSCTDVQRNELAGYMLYRTLQEKGLLTTRAKASVLTQAGHMRRVWAMLYPGEYVPSHKGHATSKGFAQIEDTHLDWLIPRPVAHLALNARDTAQLFWAVSYAPISRRLRRLGANCPIVQVPGVRPAMYTANQNYAPPANARAFPKYT